MPIFLCSVTQGPAAVKGGKAPESGALSVSVSMLVGLPAERNCFCVGSKSWLEIFNS
jgi:hypothetical protein